MAVLLRGPALRWTRVAAVTTLAGVVLGALGPFGSYLNDGMLLRSAYWIGATWLGLVLYGGGVAISRLAKAGSWRRQALLVLSVLIGSVPQAVITRMVALRVWPGLLRYGPGWRLWYVQTATIGAITVLGATAWLEARLRRPVPLPASTQGDGRTIPRAGRSISPSRDVIALQMEDHYVRVHTLAGSTLVHGPLTQAIEQVAPLEGLRIHRSWWIARHAVQRVEGSSRSMRLTLSNGLSAPVARNAVTLLREAGWLEDTPAA